MADPTPADVRRPPPNPLPDRDRLGAPLPAPLTSFVGREREVAAVADLLRRDGVRLVTLTGPGGVGKTRLALRIAEELAAAFADGAAFVDLTPIATPDLVVPTLAHALGVREAGARPLAERLVDALRDRHLLLVLDNFEQVAAAAPLVTRLLTTCPLLKVVVTSRVLLHVSGEHDYPVPPLSLETRDVSRETVRSSLVSRLSTRKRSGSSSSALVPLTPPLSSLPSTPRR